MSCQSNNPDYIKSFSPSFTLDPDATTLIVIDLQYATGSRTAGLGKLLKEQGREDAGKWRFDRIEQSVIPNVQKLLKFFRGNKLKIIYVTLGSKVADFSDMMPSVKKLAQQLNNTVGYLEHEILKEVKPEPGELVINKTSISAFTTSGIDTILRAMGLQYLIFVGISTNSCVEGTASDAADYGYNCLLVSDGCAAANEEFHNAALKNFQRLLGRVDTTENVIAELKRSL